MIRADIDWLPEEIEALRHMWADKVRVEDMVTKLGRGKTAIYNRAQQIGLPSRKGGNMSIPLLKRQPSCKKKAEPVVICLEPEPWPLERAAAVLRGRLKVRYGTLFLDGRPTKTRDAIAAANRAGAQINYPGLA